jgi:hypothetical protein
MTTIILAVLGAVTLVLYVLRRRARLQAEETNDY